MENKSTFRCSGFHPGDGKSLAVRARVTARCRYDANSGALLPVNGNFGQSAISCRQHNVDKVALETRQHGLSLRVTEAGVVLNDVGDAIHNHEAEIKYAFKRPALGRHGFDGGQKNFLHTAVSHLGRIEFAGGESTHPAGVGSSVVIIGPFVVLCRNHRPQGCPVGKGQYADFRAF
ncbi:hypothetical protein SDC9_86520 [bioreactor metagenome]|uniref:Uncharacterized protein n=1 Tax=bioreactor metagenome TaxID=1076179 RepID=A0A644ZQK8_9ZZZZ